MYTKFECTKFHNDPEAITVQKWQLREIIDRDGQQKKTGA